MTANSVSALTHRAREGLSPEQGSECRTTTSKLRAHVRDGFYRRDTMQVEEHLDACARRMGLSLEPAEVNQSLSGDPAPGNGPVWADP